MKFFCEKKIDNSQLYTCRDFDCAVGCRILRTSCRRTNSFPFIRRFHFNTCEHFKK